MEEICELPESMGQNFKCIPDPSLPERFESSQMEGYPPSAMLSGYMGTEAGSEFLIGDNTNNEENFCSSLRNCENISMENRSREGSHSAKPSSIAEINQNQNSMEIH